MQCMLIWGFAAGVGCIIAGFLGGGVKAIVAGVIILVLCAVLVTFG